MENPLPSPRPFYHDYLHSADVPSWVGKTEAWVEDQGIWGPKLATQTTRDWVWTQQMKEAEKLEAVRRAREKAADRKFWEATARSIDKQAQRWMVRAEAARKAALREAEKTREIQEEVRKVREKSEAREAERRRSREEVRVASEGERTTKVRKQRDNAAKRLVSAWNAYETRWTTLQSSRGEQLTFRTVPWPLICTPSSPSSISGANIAFFLLSPLHSGNKPRKERIREAMQRWHNDKFEPRYLPRVVEGDRKAVKEGVDIVVRCLNELLTRQPTNT
ncbi:hypothetical protein K439DRAFT_1627395 [Ramaria rubella]|nr:hypothetical protein K439DRAFT_1627395 [Ramaria rubella]